MPSPEHISHFFYLDRRIGYLSEQVSDRRMRGQAYEKEEGELQALTLARSILAWYDDENVPQIIREMRDALEAMVEAPPTKVEKEEALMLVEEAGAVLRRVG